MVNIVFRLPISIQRTTWNSGINKFVTRDIVETNLKYFLLTDFCQKQLLIPLTKSPVQTLPTLLSGELFPSDTRSALKGFTRSVTCLLVMIFLYLFPIIEQHLKLYGTFYSFACILLLAFPIVYRVLPETKDLRLEEIQVQLASITI